MQKSSFEFS